VREVNHSALLNSSADGQAAIRFAPEARKFEDRKTAAQETREMVIGLGQAAVAQSAGG